MRKSSRSRTVAGAPTPTHPHPLTGELVRPVYVGRLDTVNDWRRQLGKIYREMRKGELAPEDGTKLAFVANLGAQLAKVEQELKDIRTLQERLAAIQQSRSVAALSAPAVSRPGPLPSWAADPQVRSPTELGGVDTSSRGEDQSQ